MKMFKFRAWDKENKRWMTPEIEDSEESELRLDIWGNIHFKKPWFEEESGTTTIVSGEGMFDLSQHTGLKDKNGVEIYEGDIVKHTDNLLNITTINKVYWKGGSLVFDVVVDEGLARDISLYKITKNNDEGYDDELEVLGNIYENPELLEVEKWK